MLRDLLSGTGDLLRRLVGSSAGRLRWWICFSGALHLALILTLLVAPASTARRDLPLPVYTVDLVAGVSPAPKPDSRKPALPEMKPAQVEVPPLPEEEALDEAFLDPVVPKPPEVAEKLPPPPKEKKQAKKPELKVKKAPPEKPKKKVAKPKKAAKPKKVVRKKKAKQKKVAKQKKPAAPKVAAKKKPPRKHARKSPVKLAGKQPKAAKPKRSAGKDPQLVKRLRQRRIDAAVATARERARLRRKSLGTRQGGAGMGTAGGGNGSGGGVVRGMEFLAYRNELLSRIKDRWTWLGKRKDLEVTVGFGVGADGEIFGLKLLKVSGDASYDESVVRAVRRTSPLPPPPANHARDFAEVEVTFRPHDLDG